MKRSALLLALAILIPAGEARADFVQDVGSPLDTGNAPYSVAAADFNGDGRPDVAAANGTEGSVSIFLRGASGGFSQEASSPVTGISGASDIASGDFDGDGKRDLAVAGYVNGGNGGYVLLRKADNSGFERRATTLPVHQPRPSRPPISTATARATSCSEPSIRLGVLRAPQRREQRLRPARAAALGRPEGAVAIGDFTGDGQLGHRCRRIGPRPRASTSGSRTTISTFTFAPDAPFDVDRAAYGMAVADFNKDGRLDIAVGDSPNDKVVILLGKAGGGFVRENAYPVGDGPMAVESADFNSDGRADLAVAHQAGRRVTVLLRTASGFAHDPSSPIVTNQTATGIATADFNKDTRIDLAVANFSSNTLSILINSTPFPVPPPPPPVDLDADNDGVQRPTDCDDNNPAAFPGAVDVPNDGVDQDCVGGDAELPILKRTVAYKLGYGKAFTVFSISPGQACACGRQDQLRVQGRGLQAQEGEDQGEEERRERGTDSIREGRAPEARHEGRDQGHPSRECRPLPPLHDPLRQAPEADAAVPGPRLAQAGEVRLRG